MRTAASGLAFLAAGWMAAAPSGAASYDPLWTAVWDDPGHRDEVANDVAIDPSGNVYVAGYIDRRDIGEALNILVLKFDPSGGLSWMRTQNSIPDGMDMAFGVATDSSGFCYVAGSVSVTGGSSEGWLRKYDPAGNTIWTVQYASPNPGDQAVFRGVAVDPAGGSIYVAGCEGRGDLLEAGNGLVAKFGPAGGAPVWTRQYDGGNGLWDEFMAVAVAPNGDPLATGYATVSDLFTLVDGDILGRDNLMVDRTQNAVDCDIDIVRLNAAGDLLWRRTWGRAATTGSGLSMDSGQGIAASSAGSVFVSGITGDGNSPFVNFDRWVRAWSADGLTSPWTRIIDEKGSPDSTDAGYRCAAGPDGRAVVAGYASHSEVYRTKMLTVEQFDPSVGFTIRQDQYTSGFLLSDVGKGVAVDASGSYVVAGWETRQDLGQGKNVLVRKYQGPVTELQAAGEVVAFPNPFDPGQSVGGALKFGNLPDRATVRVWSATGRLVARVPVAGSSAAWDGRNGDGVPVASGLYYYSVDAPGVPRKTGPILVRRR